MGTRGLLGFIQKGVYRGAYNHWDSYPSGLGDAIIKFILAHTDEELEEMISKVEQLKWISTRQVQDLDYEVCRYIHFPHIPSTNDVYDERALPKDPPSLLIKTFKEQNPNFPPDIEDDEILKRYIPAPFPENVRRALRDLSWIPEHNETICRSRYELLERIWDGRQQYIVDETEFADPGQFCEYAYWIDFENKVMEVEGVVEGTLQVPFEEMRIGVIEEMIDFEWRRNKLPGAFQEAIDSLGRL